MTGLATFRADEFRTGNTGGCENRAICFERAAGKQNDGERGRTPERPQQLFAFTVEPPS